MRKGERVVGVIGVILPSFQSPTYDKRVMRKGERVVGVIGVRREGE